MSSTTLLERPPTVEPFEIGNAGGRRRWRWTLDQALRLADLGLLPPDFRFELIDGELIEIMATGPRHEFIVLAVAEALRHLVPAEFHVRPEKSVVISSTTVPLPDFSVVKGSRRDYRDRHPGPQDVVLIIEVSDSTLPYDRSVKAALYAAAGIPEYWVVNLAEECVEVFRDPAEGAYGSAKVMRTGEMLFALEMPRHPVAVSILLGEGQEDALDTA